MKSYKKNLGEGVSQNPSRLVGWFDCIRVPLRYDTKQIPLGRWTEIVKAVGKTASHVPPCTEKGTPEFTTSAWSPSLTQLDRSSLSLPNIRELITH